MKQKEKPIWFKGEWYKKGDKVISYKNQKNYFLNAHQLSVFDYLGNLDLLISMMSSEQKSTKEVIEMKTDYRKCIDWFFHEDAKLASELFTPKMVLKYDDDIKPGPSDINDLYEKGVRITRTYKTKDDFNKGDYIGRSGVNKTPMWVFLIGIPVIWIILTGVFFLVKFLISLFA